MESAISVFHKLIFLFLEHSHALLYVVLLDDKVEKIYCNKASYNDRNDGCQYHGDVSINHVGQLHH